MNGSQHAKLLVDPDFPKLKNLLIETTGLAYYRTRDEILSSKIFSRMHELGLDNCADYLKLLGLSGAGEMDCLISRLTIGETYFFRTTPHFEALEQRVFPELLARRTADRRIEIWSAGCATGPEPYSLSLLLRHRMAARTAGWDLPILATDINPQFLEAAARAAYGQWAFRTMPEELLRDCFKRQDKLWRLDSRYTRDVRFVKHNLVRDPYPPVPGPKQYDLIVCRNVLIYFSLEIIRSVVRGFYECLKPGGWLLVGHSEPNIELFDSFQTVRSGDTVLYQRGDLSPSVGISVHRSLRELQNSLNESCAVKPPAEPTISRSRSAEQPPRDERSLIRRLTDEGRWQEALELCLSSLAQDALDPRLHFLLALIYHNLHQEVARDQSIRKALYLDRGFVEAHYYRGVFLSESGNGKEAGKSFRAVLRLLEGQGAVIDHTSLPGAAAPDQLRRMSQYYLDRLGQQSSG